MCLHLLFVSQNKVAIGIASTIMNTKNAQAYQNKTKLKTTTYTYIPDRPLPLEQHAKPVIVWQSLRPPRVTPAAPLCRTSARSARRALGVRPRGSGARGPAASLLHAAETPSPRTGQADADERFMKRNPVPIFFFSQGGGEGEGAGRRTPGTHQMVTDQLSKAKMALSWFLLCCNTCFVPVNSTFAVINGKDAYSPSRQAPGTTPGR